MISGIGMTSQRTRQRMLTRLRAQGISDEITLAAMEAVPRHIFVDEALSSRAYEDVSLPIGFGQTISQPYTVARMTEILRGKGQLGKVLEIGTGCGYQTAVLARLAKEVYSVERISPLLMKARGTLRELRMRNIKFWIFHRITLDFTKVSPLPRLATSSKVIWPESPHKLFSKSKI